MAMLHMPDGAPLPKDVPLTMTPTDEPWEGLQGSFGKGVAVFDQDQANLVKFQAGLRQNGLKQIHLSNYQANQCKSRWVKRRSTTSRYFPLDSRL
jgi:hypothetical protein